MPLFEFKCRSCGHQFETLQFSTSRAFPACPACDAPDVEKLYSVFGTASGSGRDSSPRPSFGGG